jgi:zona occludens toxin (predicted ATPase)
MITVITGLTGSGKTWFMSRLALKRRNQGDRIFANLAFNFPKDNEGVTRWHSLSETFNLTDGVICIDEAQKLFDAHAWAFLPMAFAEKIASHRHQGLDILTTTQDFGHIDLRMRSNCHELYHCQSVFRYPKNDRVKPLLQITRITKKQRSFDDNNIKWTVVRTRTKYISKLWTKELYNTYANINLSHFLCQIKRDKKKWLIILQSRQMSNQRGGR